MLGSRRQSLTAGGQRRAEVLGVVLAFVGLSANCGLHAIGTLEADAQTDIGVAGRPGT